ncbi:hypothetical protein BOX15_Mlig021340g1 [Macrostomum lignano]|uniref:Uncharacterized protein n=2 Tax=Macrostomum lignano TaxID=282301 RepID=A0A267DVR4_9PLAT|nr:hypothetical protein BOX15_Mlig021340g1 [Macrostomum lignano]
MMHQQQHQQQRIRLQAITQQQLGRFRQVQATRELCDQDADLAAQLGRRWADDGNDHGGDNHERGGVQPAVTDDADNSLEAREAALISQRRQLEDRLSRLAEEADRLRRRCGNGGVGSGGGDFTLARRMQDAEAQLAQVMSETELADSSLARCIAELDECRWRLRRSERRHRRSRRRHRRHRRRREEEEEDADEDANDERQRRSRSVDAWVQTGRAGYEDRSNPADEEFHLLSGQQRQAGLPVVAPGSPIYDNPSNSAPFAAGGDGGGGHPLALAAAPSRYAHSRQSLRQAVTASAAAAGPVPAVNGAAGIEERPLQSRVTHYQQQQQQQPLRRPQHQKPPQRPVSAYYFADSPLMSSRQPQALAQPPAAAPQHHQSSRNIAADLDPTYLTTDNLILSSDAGYHLRRPQAPLISGSASTTVSSTDNPYSYNQPVVPVVSAASNFPAPVPGQRRSSASPVVSKTKAASKRQQQTQMSSSATALNASSGVSGSHGNVVNNRPKSQCAQS